MRAHWAVAVALLLTGCVAVHGPKVGAPRPEATRAAIEPERTRLDQSVCGETERRRDRGSERAQVAEATRQVETDHKARMAGLDTATAGGAARDREFGELQHAYHRARFQAVYPLAAEGNAHAVYELASQYRWVESGFTDDVEWLRLLTCASGLGDPGASVELMRVFWHDKGDGSFATIQRNRAVGLDLAKKAAAGGDMGGIESLGVYIGMGRHQYPVNGGIGRRMLSLCAHAPRGFCKARLVEAADENRRYRLEDPVDAYLLLEAAAAEQPALYGERRDRLRASLSPKQLDAAARKPERWRPLPWDAFEAEWRAIRAEVEANGCPASISCRLGQVCVCPKS